MPDKVTEGEWEADRLGHVKSRDQTWDEFIADCNLEDEDGDYRPIEQIRGNARLMAASKKMYRMLVNEINPIWLPVEFQIKINRMIQEIDVEVD